MTHMITGRRFRPGESGRRHCSGGAEEGIAREKAMVETLPGKCLAEAEAQVLPGKCLAEPETQVLPGKCLSEPAAVYELCQTNSN